MAPMAAVVSGSTPLRLGGQSHARKPFRPQRPCRAPVGRPDLVVRAAEADRSREQDTVGDLSRDQVQVALERQLQRSKGKAGSSEDGGGSCNGEAEAVEEVIETQEREAPATAVEREESVRALGALKERVPLMSQDDVQSAIDRLLRRGGSAEEPSISSSSEDSSSDSGKSADGGSGSSGSSEAATPAGGSGKQGKYDADRTYEDGSLLFTAESLAKVSFEDLKP